MKNRLEWTFQYPAGEVLVAAQSKKEQHLAKFKWWEAKKTETMVKVRESGIEVADSVASSYSNVKSNFGPQIVIDETLQRDLTECQQKILQHHAQMKEYDTWVQVLSKRDGFLELTHEDYMFFFGE